VQGQLVLAKSSQGAVMSKISGTGDTTVQPFPARHSTAVTDELNGILAMLRDIAPKDGVISFDFDGQLHVHLDVRRREEIMLLESVLPALGGGLLHSLSRAATPHHPFFHRISALVAR
jgi:hypothetical protein